MILYSKKLRFSKGQDIPSHPLPALPADHVQYNSTVDQSWLRHDLYRIVSWLLSHDGLL